MCMYIYTYIRTYTYVNVCVYIYIYIYPLRTYLQIIGGQFRVSQRFTKSKLVLITVETVFRRLASINLPLKTVLRSLIIVVQVWVLLIYKNFLILLKTVKAMNRQSRYHESESEH
jgi:hypothetical protein